jgi:hypothetical protein
MSNTSRLEKIIDHFKNPDANPLTEDLQQYIDQLDYCRDLLKRFGSKEVWKALALHFEVSRATAYNIITDTRRFFSLYPNEDSDKDFWRRINIERLEKLYSLALAAAESSKDYKYCSDILKRIEDLRGLDKAEDFDPAKLPPAVIQLVLPSGQSVNLHDMQKKDVPAVIDLVEDIGYSVEDMAKELEELNKGQDE